MSRLDPSSWNILKTTEEYRQYKSPLHPVNQKRIIELDSGRDIDQIVVNSYNQKKDTVDCRIEFANGSYEEVEVLVSSVQDLLAREKPALELP